MDHEDVARGYEQGDRREIPRRIEAELRIHHAVGRHRHAADQDRVAVGVGAHHRLHADVGSGARAVLHQHGLAEPLGERRRERARQDVHRAAGRGWHDEAQRLGGKPLAGCQCGKENQGGGEELGHGATV